MFVAEGDCLHEDEAVDGFLPELFLHLLLDLLDVDVEVGESDQVVLLVLVDLLDLPQVLPEALDLLAELVLLDAQLAELPVDGEVDELGPQGQLHEVAAQEGPGGRAGVLAEGLGVLGLEVEDAEVGDVLGRDLQHLEVDHREHQGSLCVQDLTGLVGQPIFLHVYPVLQLLYCLQEAVRPRLDRHLRCLLQLLRPQVFLIDLQQLYLKAKLRVNRSQHDRADFFQVIFVEVPLELSIGHDAVVVRVLLELRPRFHQLQLQRKEQVVGWL